MITLDSLSLRYGQQVLFDNIKASIGPRDCIGLVGSNGAGKSTLLRMLAGELEPDDGMIHRARYVTVGYLPQDGLTSHGKTLYSEVESVFSELLQLQRRIDEATARLHSIPETSEEYAELLQLIGSWEHQLMDLEPQKLPGRIERVLRGLGFSGDDLERPCSEFSGGWQMRIALAKLLLTTPSLLLLDEPTNHLDIFSQRWLENYLRSYEGALMIVSHDRAFLDTLCRRTFVLSKGRLEVYSGNYSYYEKESQLRKEALVRAAKNQEKKFAKTEAFIERFRYKATKASQVQSRIRALEKVERIELEEEETSIHFEFPPAPRSGQVVIELKGVRKAYGDLEVYRNLDLKLERGDRVAVVGANGAGKSTLVKLLAGVEPFQEGVREVGYNVFFSYFAQHQADALDPESDVLGVAESAAPPGESKRARSLLGAFLFTGDAVFKKVKVLSGGEKNRLALAKMLLQPFNFLILDEPTNHLDMRSKQVLCDALKNYQGTMIIVSHDRSFLDPLVTKVFEVSPDGLKVYWGNVSEYLQKKEEEDVLRLAAEQRSEQSEKSDLKSSSEFNARDRRRLVAERNRQLAPLRRKKEELEQFIAKAESEIAAMEKAMADPEFFKKGEESRQGMLRYDDLKLEVEAAYEKWAALEEEIDRLKTDFPV